MEEWNDRRPDVMPGSLAYDLDRLEPDPEEYGAPMDRDSEQEEPQVRREPRSRQGVSLLAVAGGLLAAVILVLGILGESRIFDISAESSALEQRLRELELEQTRLRIAYESAFNLTELEDYAVNELGMRKIAPEQIVYIDNAAPDRAEVIAAEEKDSLTDRVGDFLAGLRSYFGGQGE